MPTVSGNWKSPSMQPVPTDISPRLAFRLNTAATDPDGNVYFTVPIYVTPLSDGSFSATLPRTDLLTPADPSIREVWVNLYAEWLEDSSDPSSGFSQLLCQLRVPGSGGHIGDLVKIVVANDMVYTSATANDSDVYSGFQLNTVTGILYKRVD